MNLCIDRRKKIRFYLFIFSAFQLVSAVVSICTAQNTPVNELVRIRTIYISGNNITKPKVILKELTFHQGDSILKSNIEVEKERSIHNALNTSLFNYVYITFEPVGFNLLDVYVRVEERWYLWAVPLFEQTDRNVSSFLKNSNWNMINYGAYVKYDNFRGRHEKISFRFRTGYSNQLLLNYDIPEYNNKWGWGMWFDYNAYDQTAVYTMYDKPFYINTIGDQLYKSMANGLYVQYRSSLYTKHRLALKYSNFSVSDTVLAVNPNFFPNSRSDLQYFELEYRVIHDTRDSKYYPLVGGVRQLTLRQTGLGTFDSGLDYLSTEMKISQYRNLIGRIYGGTEWTLNYTGEKTLPYFYKNGIGYKDFLRGYEIYVVDGQSYLFSKNKISYQLVKPRIKDLNLVALSKFSKIHYTFYLNVFYDFGYVNNYTSTTTTHNRMQNNYLYGYGAGIDLVTFYDKALSFNYAFNKFGESGFFFHINVNM
jgi:outer membrane protein assembly factor BamA